MFNIKTFAFVFCPIIFFVILYCVFVWMMPATVKASPIVTSGHVYRHFKGHKYVILCIARDTEDENLRNMVVYQELGGEHKIWVRPLSMFTEKVDKAKYPSAEQTYRFEEIAGSEVAELNVSSSSSDGGVKAGDRYRHFKGNKYVILCIASDTEDENLREMVVYQDLSNEKKIWVRPLAMFIEKVDSAKYPAVEQTYRFERIV